MTDTELTTQLMPAPPYMPAVLDVGAPLGGLPYLSDFARLAEAICQTEMVPNALRGRPDAALAVMLAGFELNVGPMQALQSIDIIQGRPAVSPELMRALAIKAGHQLIVTATDDTATIRCHRRDWPADQWSDFTWTLDDAKRAGLVRADSPWTKYPRAMLTARVTAEACRAVFPDVIAGLSYTPEEVSEFAPVPAPKASAPPSKPLPGSAHLDTPSGEPAETQGSAPGATAVATAKMISSAQVRMLRAQLGQLEVIEPIDVQLVVSDYIGRQIQELEELTAAEARVAIDRAKAELAVAASQA